MQTSLLCQKGSTIQYNNRRKLKTINKQIYDRSISWLDKCGRGTGFMRPNLQCQLKHFSLIEYARIRELLGYLVIRDIFLIMKLVN